jgi:pimeloyl-ACP methyl ester carboxylesterase
VLFGAEDDAWPPAEQRDMARRLGARSVAVPGAAHSPAVENPAGTAAALLDFWPPARPVRPRLAD